MSHWISSIIKHCCLLHSKGRLPAPVSPSKILPLPQTIFFYPSYEEIQNIHNVHNVDWLFEIVSHYFIRWINIENPNVIMPSLWNTCIPSLCKIINCKPYICSHFKRNKQSKSIYSKASLRTVILWHGFWCCTSHACPFSLLLMCYCTLKRESICYCHHVWGFSAKVCFSLNLPHDTWSKE